MQIVLIAILVIALLITVISYLVMGIRLSRRARHLERQCQTRRLHFSRDDPYELPLRYHDFALMSCGHSPKASNVAHGRLGPWTGWMYDFRYEVGHGTRRMARRYSVVVIDTSMLLPEVLMWNQGDAENAPLDVRQIDGRIGQWAYTGDAELADLLSQAEPSLADEGLSMQTHGCMLMFSVPVRRGRLWDYTTWVDRAGQCVQQLGAYENELYERATRRLRVLET